MYFTLFSCLSESLTFFIPNSSFFIYNILGSSNSLLLFEPLMRIVMF